MAWSRTPWGVFVRRCSLRGRPASRCARISPESGVSREPNGTPQPAQVTLAVEHYGRVWRTLEKKIPVTLQIDADNRFFDADLNSFNIVADLPGTDKADEVVMLGAHFDSWHTGTGATDNAAGSAVMMAGSGTSSVSRPPSTSRVTLADF